MEEKKQIHFSSRPKDMSLEAFKEWILGITSAITGETKDDLTPEEWEKIWRKFLEKQKK